MNAVDYLKEKARMTNNCNGGCDECPLRSEENGEGIGCTEFEGEFPEQAIEIVKKWAKENPVKTYLSVLLEKFPNTKLHKSIPETFCPYHIFKTNKPCYDGYLPCVDCWNREYKEEE